MLLFVTTLIIAAVAITLIISALIIWLLIKDSKRNIKERRLT